MYMQSVAVGNMRLQIPFADVPIINVQSTVPLTVIQIYPLILKGSISSPTFPSLSAPLVKLHLLNQSKRIVVQWDQTCKNQNCGEESNIKNVHNSIIQNEKEYRTEIVHGILHQNEKRDIGHTIPIVIIPSQDPTTTEGIPCIIRAFTARHVNLLNDLETLEPMLNHDTLCHIFPSLEVNSINIQTCSCEVDDSRTIYHSNLRPSFKHDILGESNVSEYYSDKRLLLNYESETVEALTLRMNILLDREIVIGTTMNSIQHWTEAKQRRRRFKSFLTNQNKEDKSIPMVHEDTNVVDTTDKKSFLDSATLIVHDPFSGSGKTTLVATIAKCNLFCDMVHVINAPFLFARYGANGADAALETLLHQIVLSAAVQSKKVCIILDHLETFLPPSMSGGRNNGDPAVPALNAIATYLSKLHHSLRTKKSFPFPTKSPFYNSTNGIGHIYSTQLCLVAVVTIEDTVGDLYGPFGDNRYRLPTLTIKDRFLIMMQLLDDRGITLDQAAKENLPILLASTQTNKRSIFNSIITKLESIRSKDVDVVTLTDLKKVFDTSSNNIKLSDSQSISDASESNNDDKFSSIGGNKQAKKALLDALAFDDKKRLALARFGMSPPNGCILYGPPGNGKTLLAKAVARMMGNKGNNLIHDGGLFISLSASDIVRSEVGKSEKLIASAFDMAQKSAPAVIFIDEFQALFTSRDDEDGQSKGSGRLSSVLLQCLDDVSKWKKADRLVDTMEAKHEYKRVVVLAATNTPWMVDKAFFRAGRFDRVVHVNLPDQSEREEILRLLISRMRLDNNTSIDDVCQSLAKTTHNFSGADLAALVRAAAVRSLHEQINKEEAEVKVNLRHFLESKQYDFPTSTSDQRLVERLNRWKP